MSENDYKRLTGIQDWKNNWNW